jgi:hypothetical protein
MIYQADWRRERATAILHPTNGNRRRAARVRDSGGDAIVAATELGDGWNRKHVRRAR